MDVQDFSCETEETNNSEDAFKKLHHRRDMQHLKEIKICIAVLWFTRVRSLLSYYQRFGRT
jgi:hypothetical protein